MSFIKNVITFGLISAISGLGVAAQAQTNGSLTAPLSNSSFTYCNWNNFISTNDVEAARQIIGTSAYFYITENTSYNVVNGRCVNNLVANYVPYITGHKTSFDVNNAGAVNNVKLINSAPTIDSVSCNDTDTEVRVKDPNQDSLKYNTISGSNDFDVSTSQESNNVLKVVFKRRNYNFNATNSINLYVDEVSPANLNAGYVNVPAGTNPYNTTKVNSDKEFATVRFDIQISGNCSSNNNIVKKAPADKIYLQNTNGSMIRWNLSGLNPVSTTTLNFIPSGWKVAAVGDFNADGNDDLLLQNGGSSVIWYLNSNGMMTNQQNLTTVGSDWTIVGAGDYNNDGRSDIFWRNNDGSNVIWINNNGNFDVNNSKWLQRINSDWSIVSTRDQNGDGKADIFWRNNDGSNVIWYNTNSEYSLNNSRWIQKVGNDWNLVNAADFDNNGSIELFWNNAKGENVIWSQNGNSWTFNSLPNTATDWTPTVRD
jgi:FG-GAP-like repeat